jgi:hypothetical protein
MKVKVLDPSGQYKKAAEQLVLDRGGEKGEGTGFDLLIAFAGQESTAVGFQVAEAADRERYVLVLVPEGRTAVGIRVESKFLTVKTFNSQNLEMLLRDYLDKHRRGNLRRFNFVIPRPLAEYLEWVPRGKRKSKSDFVRDLIQKEMEQEQKYPHPNGTPDR